MTLNVGFTPAFNEIKLPKFDQKSSNSTGSTDSIFAGVQPRPRPTPNPKPTPNPRPEPAPKRDPGKPAGNPIPEGDRPGSYRPPGDNAPDGCYNDGRKIVCPDKK